MQLYVRAPPHTLQQSIELPAANKQDKTLCDDTVSDSITTHRRTHALIRNILLWLRVGFQLHTRYSCRERLLTPVKLTVEMWMKTNLTDSCV